MEIVGKSQVALGNRGNWCYPFENQDTLGTETLVIDLKFDITQRIMPNWLSNWNFSACQTAATMGEGVGLCYAVPILQLM